mmetsp:Transcript_2095/g.3873  ORF Transcript_2095/g.3873 Transcript_2095/m.3873 type:complete len:126 (-) Transcript_2095:344-721(-)
MNTIRSQNQTRFQNKEQNSKRLSSPMKSALDHDSLPTNEFSSHGALLHRRAVHSLVGTGIYKQFTRNLVRLTIHNFNFQIADCSIALPCLSNNLFLPVSTTFYKCYTRKDKTPQNKKILSACVVV